MERTTPNYRWVMLALLWLIYASFGLVSGPMAVLVTPIVADLNLTHSQMGTILGSWQFVFIFSSLLAGPVIDRWGIRRTILVAAVIVVISAVLRYLANGFGTLLAAVALYGVGMPAISVGGATAIGRWFTGKGQGLALGLYMTGAWAGALLALSLTNSLVMPLVHNDWRSVFLFFGAIALAAGVLWLVFAREKAVESSAKRAGPIRTLTQITSIRNVQLMVIVGVISLATNHGMMGWLPTMLQDSGLSPVTAGYAATVNMLIGIPVVLLVPGVVPGRFRGRVLALAAPFVALGLLGIINTSGLLQWGSLLVMGLALSAYLPLLLRMIMDGSGISAQYLGSANGVFMSISQVGGFLAPYAMGSLYDWTDGHAAGVILLAALNLVIIPVALRLSRSTSAATVQPATARATR